MASAQDLEPSRRFPRSAWLLRCDRVDFPPGGVAYRHIAPRPGNPPSAPRRADDRAPSGDGRTYRGAVTPGSRGPDPVLATASATEETAFVRVLLLPRSGRGSGRSATSIRPTSEKPKLQQRDRPPRASRSSRDADGRPGPRRPARAERGRAWPSASRARATSRCSTRCTTRRSGSSRRRHEGGAANTAEAYGKLTGRPGVCLVTRGPGATHAAVGVHTAYQDSTPMILLVGQVPRGIRGREAFQEVDFARVLRPLAKGGLADRRRRRGSPSIVAAHSRSRPPGRPGPVVLALPEDVLAEEADVEDAAPSRSRSPRRRPRTLARPRELSPRRSARSSSSARAAGRADRPRTSLAFAEANELPGRVRVPLAGLRRQPLAELRRRARSRRSTRSSRQRIRDADLLARARRPARRGPDARVHARRAAAPAPDARPRPPRSRTSSAASTRPTSRSSPGCPSSRRAARELEPVEPRWRDWTREARARLLRGTSSTSRWRAPWTSARSWRSCATPARDAVQTSGAGNYTVWAHRFAQFTQLRHAARARAAGSMGYGLPAAVAAKLVHPDRVVVCFAGDGDFLMSSPELATAVQYELPVVVLLVNNGMYATIRMHQERHVSPDGSSAPTSSTRTSPALARPTAPTASASSGPRTSRRRSSARSHRGCRRCSSFGSIRSESARGSS